MNNSFKLMLTLCQREESILLNDDILDTLERPDQVRLMINEEQCRLLLQACTTEDRGAVVVPDDKIVQFPISGRSLLRHIRKLTGWTDYKARVIEGRYIPEYNAILFELKKAVPVDVEEIEPDPGPDPGPLN